MRLDRHTIHWDNIGLGLQQMPGSSVHVKLHAESFGTIPTLQHKAGKLKYAPYQSAPIQYGAKKQYTTQESKVPLLEDKAKRFIQQVCGKFLLLGRAFDSTLLCPISTIASQSSKPTEDTYATNTTTPQLPGHARRCCTLLPCKQHGASST